MNFVPYMWKTTRNIDCMRMLKKLMTKVDELMKKDDKNLYSLTSNVQLKLIKIKFVIKLIEF